MKKPGLPEGRPGPFQPIGPCGPWPDLDQVLAGAAGAAGAWVGTPSEITSAPEQPPPVQPPVQPLVQPLVQLRRQGRRQQRFARQRVRSQPQLGSAAQQLGPLSQQLAAQDGPASQAGSQQPRRRRRPAAEAESAATRPTNTNANSIARNEKRFMRTSREKNRTLMASEQPSPTGHDPGRLPDRSTPKFESAGRRRRNAQQPRLAAQCSDWRENAPRGNLAGKLSVPAGLSIKMEKIGAFFRF